MKAATLLISTVLAGALWLGLAGCIKTESTVEFKPVEIHMTLDVNVKVQKEVDQAYDYVYGPGTPGATQPASKPAGQ